MVPCKQCDNEVPEDHETGCCSSDCEDAEKEKLEEEGAAALEAATAAAGGGAGGGGGGAAFPAARIGDPHVCPMVTGVVPHVGGPIVAGLPTVLIGNMPAATATKQATCVGPPDTIAKGSATVLIGSMPAARLLDNCSHGGIIVMGNPTTLIGG